MRKFLLAVLYVLLFTSLAYGQACIELTEGFEDGWEYCLRGSGDPDCNTSDYIWACDFSDNCAGGSLSTAFARIGSYSLKVTNEFDDGYDRSEFHWWGGLGDSVREIAYGQDFWVSFSIFIPSTWTASEDSVVLFQVMQDWDHQDGEPMSGPAGNLAYNSSGTFEYTIKGDSRLSHTFPLQTHEIIELGQVTPGAWHDFVLHYDEFNWDATNSVEMWMRIGTGDWNKVVNETNRNTAFRNSSSYAQYAYLKFAVYAWAWAYYSYPSRPSPDTITLYFDALKWDIDGDCTFEDMVPDALPSLTITITGPESDPTSTTSSTQTVSGTSSGATSISYTTNRGESGNCTGTDNWSCADIPLHNGANNVVVTASGSDATNQDTIAINYYENATDSTTLTHTGGLLYFNWQGTEGPTQISATVNSESTDCNSWYIGYDSNPGTSSYMLWDTIVTDGYELDVLSNRGSAGPPPEQPQWDPSYWDLTQGYHILYLVKADQCALMQSVTFGEYTFPESPASPGGFAIRYEAGGLVGRYESGGHAPE